MRTSTYARTISIIRAGHSSCARSWASSRTRGVPYRSPEMRRMSTLCPVRSRSSKGGSVSAVKGAEVVPLTARRSAI